MVRLQDAVKYKGSSLEEKEGCGFSLIRIEGKPIPWTSPVVGKFGTYSKHAAQKKVMQNIIASQYKGPLLKDRVIIQVEFRFCPPKSISKKLRQAMLDGMIPHIKRPDGTNLWKLFEDACTGIIWLDDNQVVEAVISKRYAESDCSILRIFS